MKRILITVLITLFCFGIGATSFIVNDLSNYVKWYQTDVRPTMDKKKQNKEEHKKKDHYQNKPNDQQDAVHWEHNRDNK